MTETTVKKLQEKTLTGSAFQKSFPYNADARKRKVRRIVLLTLQYAIMAFIAAVMLLPFYWSLITSFRDKAQILDINAAFFPTSFTPEHYKTVFSKIPFGSMLANSVTVTLAGVFTNLFFGSLAAYSFSKIRFTGHKIIFNIMLISMMIPGVITLIPTFLVLLHFPLAGGNGITGSGGTGFYDSLAAVVLPGAVGVYGIFFMRQFFVSLSDEFAESARMDGASEFRIFWNIYLPLVLPGLMTLGIFTFQNGWNNFMWPNIVLQSQDKWLLTMAFKEFKTTTWVDYGPLMASSILMALPVLVLFMFMQKYFIAGVAIGGVKD